VAGVFFIAGALSFGAGAAAWSPSGSGGEDAASRNALLDNNGVLGVDAGSGGRGWSRSGSRKGFVGGDGLGGAMLNVV